MAKRNANKPKKENSELTLSALKDINKKFKEKFEIDIDGYTVKIDKYWSQEKINELVSEYFDKFEKHQDDFTETLLAQYCFLLMIRYFSSIKIPAKFEQQIQWLEQLVTPGYYGQIISKFPEDDVAKVLNQLSDGVENLTKEINRIVEEQKKLKNEEVNNEDKAESEDSE